MRKILTAAACLVASTSLASPPPAVVLENERVRVWRVSTAPAAFGHRAGVFESLCAAAGRLLLRWTPQAARAADADMALNAPRAVTPRYGRGSALPQRTSSISLNRHSFVKKGSSGL